ncbi:hypothetical protein [Bifidobacterium crudilactis]|uniref:hypothetical protein n=1 Tax=Bifidobacterium crudilactis TaxID=327277 RepID=UPI00264A328A|nr:hypothetical protein [Bifidobacterium crudilactis]MDN5973435.1 hypothetical protein [Bifidobacterium crudilactis]MDN6210484.1 hypothetical protein [Bifidobacterium crudilactis]MDN6235030.1 hypothetical protein [Bifidobacterium crudilactis]MDN6468248.1 hypothetical protein [Bifidobacterium crudilactis]MDN6522548.1 hypothetical protein [Bifidobacterium crudilactis]
MTQEYTPDTDDAIDLIVAGMGTLTQLGLAPVGYPRTATDAEEAAKRWLAAHDAQIRAEALTLTDKESNKLSEVIWNYVEDEDLDAATGEVKSTLETIAKTRMEQKQ